MRIRILLLVAGCTTVPAPPPSALPLDEVDPRPQAAICRLSLERARAEGAEAAYERLRNALERPRVPALAACALAATPALVAACLAQRRDTVSSEDGCVSEPHCEVVRHERQAHLELATHEGSLAAAHPTWAAAKARHRALHAWAERLRAREVEAVTQAEAGGWARTRRERVKRFDPALGAAEDLPTSLQALAFSYGEVQLRLELEAEHWGERHPRRLALEARLEGLRQRATDAVTRELTTLASTPELLPVAGLAVTLTLDDDTGEVCEP